MPTYAYACTTCDHRFEAQQSFSDDALTDCPECTGRLRKLFNSVGIVFKGSGFYRTDSRSTNASTESTSTGAASGAAASSGSGSAGSSATGTSSGSSTGSPSSASSSTPAKAPAGSAA